jgi:zinc/manganese transport system permease protein
LSSLIGLLLSFNFSLPSGPAIILVAGVAYVISLAFGSVDGIATKLVRRSHTTS